MAGSNRSRRDELDRMCVKKCYWLKFNTGNLVSCTIIDLDNFFHRKQFYAYNFEHLYRVTKLIIQL